MTLSDKEKKAIKAKANRLWDENNKERRAEIRRNWRINNLDRSRELKRISDAKRKAIKIKASPKWANDKYIRLFYKLAQIEAKRIGVPVHVDHIVPLISDVVCGLHCEDNMQLLTETQNRSKKNFFEV